MEEQTKPKAPHLVSSIEDLLRSKPKIAAEIEAKASPVRIFTEAEKLELQARLTPPSKIRKPEELKPLIAKNAPRDDEEEPMNTETITMTPGREGFVPLSRVEMKPRAEVPKEESHEERVGTAYLTVLGGKRRRDKIVAQIKLQQDELRQVEISLAEAQNFLDNLVD